MTLIACPNAEQLYDPLNLDELPITDETRSKKAFRAYVEANPDAHCLIEPAHRFGFPGVKGPLLTPRSAIDEVVTNHPRRSWFGAIALDKHGQVTLK